MKLLTVLILFLGININSMGHNVSIKSLQDTSMVYDFPEQMAQFPGGPDDMDDFIRRNMQVPANLSGAERSGKIYVEFIVEKDGTLTNFAIRRSSNSKLDSAALDIVKKMPNWLPGKMRGKSVRVKQTIPIVFVAT
tara:strand:+ start:108 stop:515 length:408 start_codon:yes stop_codon:yes gene_type:complete